jgi:hypothetical protein
LIEITDDEPFRSNAYREELRIRELPPLHPIQESDSRCVAPVQYEGIEPSIIIHVCDPNFSEPEDSPSSPERKEPCALKSSTSIAGKEGQKGRIRCRDQKIHNTITSDITCCEPTDDHPQVYILLPLQRPTPRPIIDRNHRPIGIPDNDVRNTILIEILDQKRRWLLPGQRNPKRRREIPTPIPEPKGQLPSTPVRIADENVLKPVPIEISASEIGRPRCSPASAPLLPILKKIPPVLQSQLRLATFLSPKADMTRPLLLGRRSSPIDKKCRKNEQENENHAFCERY